MCAHFCEGKVTLDHEPKVRSRTDLSEHVCTYIWLVKGEDLSDLLVTVVLWVSNQRNHHR